MLVSVAKGCALLCAIISPTFKVREFQVYESFPFSIALSWKGAAPDAQNEFGDDEQSISVFPKGNLIPRTQWEPLMFYKSGIWIVQYADVNEVEARAKISTYMGLQADNDKAKLRPAKAASPEVSSPSGNQTRETE